MLINFNMLHGSGIVSHFSEMLPWRTPLKKNLAITTILLFFLPALLIVAAFTSSLWTDTVSTKISISTI